MARASRLRSPDAARSGSSTVRPRWSIRRAARPAPGSRARASSPRLVSCVAVAVRPCGHSPARARIMRVKGRRADSAGRGGIAADLVEREQAVVAIERGVLQRLRHHRPGELLHLEGEAAHARARCAGRGPARSGRASARRAGNRRCRRRRRTSRARAFSIACSMISARSCADGAGRRDDRCGRPENAARTARAPAAGCRRNSRGCE